MEGGLHRIQRLSRTWLSRPRLVQNPQRRAYIALDDYRNGDDSSGCYGGGCCRDGDVSWRAANIYPYSYRRQVVDLVLQGTASVLIQFSVPIILGLIRLRGRAKALGRPRACLAWIWDADGIKRGLVVIVAILFALFNLFIVVIYPIPPYSGTIPGWVIPTIVLVLLIAAVLYYILFFRAAVLISKDTRRIDMDSPSVSYGLQASIALSVKKNASI